MKIYGTYIGNDYEGGHLSTTLFKLKKDAVMEAEALAMKLNEERNMDHIILDSGEEWRDESYYIKVIECELI